MIFRLQDLFSCGFFVGGINMSLIQIKDFSFSYQEPLFENIDLKLDTDMKIGLVGENGSGKTTFLKILMNNHHYPEIFSSVKFSYFPYEILEENQLTVDIIYQFIFSIPLWKIEKEMNLLEINKDCLYQLYSTLSQGEKTKILLIILFLREDDLVLIDEPTNHLDMESRYILSKYLNKKSGFILVSHDRYFMNECVDHILEIRNHQMYLINCHFDTWYKEREKRWQFEYVQNERLKKEIKSLDRAAKQMAVWSEKVENSKNGHKISGIKADKGRIGHQSAKMMKKSKNAQKRKEKALEQKKLLLKDVKEKEEVILEPLDIGISHLISLKNISVEFERKVINDFSLDVYKGDKIALIGKNGCGKSTIIKIVAQEFHDFYGKLVINPQLQICYVSQRFNMMEKNIKDYINNHNGNISLCFTILAKLGCSREMFLIPLQKLSNGQKRKVMIACALSIKAHVYLFDEILNYIDLESRSILEKMMKESKATMIFVEHDHHFVETVANRKICIKNL